MTKSDGLTPEKRALLARRLKGAAAASASASAAPVQRVPRRETGGSAPLSFAQFYVWASDRALPGNPSFNLPYGVRLRGSLNFDALEQALNALVMRHESLRTTFAIEDGTPVQVIHPDHRIAITRVDLSSLAPDDQDARLHALATAESVESFDITTLPLIRALLVGLAPDEHVLIINVHHIVSDGLSLDPMFRELDVLYTAFAAGNRPDLPQLPVQYADFATWLRKEVDRGAYAAQEKYWRERLSGRLSTMALPVDHPRPAVRTFLGGNVYFTIEPELVAKLNALNVGPGASFFSVALAAFQTLLHRCSGSEDLLILTPVAIRNHEELKPLIGDLLNLVPLRCDVSGSPTFSELLRRSRESTLDALTNKDVPFDRIVDGVTIERRSGREPVFQSLLQVLPEPAVKLGDLEVEPFDIDAAISQFDVSLHLYGRSGGYRGRFEYSTELFERATVERLCANFVRALELVAAEPEVPVASLALPHDVRPAVSSAEGESAEARRSAPHVAPQGALEKQIAKVWSEVLNVEQVGVNDNFFDLGGHSLLLVKTCQLLGAELKRSLAVVDLFTYPTVAALAKHLGQAETDANALVSGAAERSRRRASGTGATEPIAIIGMAGRFPGARDVEAFWANLRAGRESIAFFTAEELREAGVPESVLADPDFVRAIGYLEDVDLFDASYFGYSTRDAESFDPQERLLLECAVETLERAGYDPDRYPGYIGVFAGALLNNYLAEARVQGIPMGAPGWLAMGVAAAGDFLTTRISYKLNLRGPSVNVQTACSTSLVAVHQACRSLQEGECDMALAGGVSIMLPAKSGFLYVEGGIFSRDGHCRTFDAKADGTVGGNGVAMVLLKRLSDALADGDHIHAVIRGTAVNNDGAAKAGYTAPSVEGQAQVIALAQAAAQVDPATIDYVEAHGTATALGDPIEITALSRVFGDGAGRDTPCLIGSVKSNIGHLFTAAGVAGLIKATLSLEHREMVPSLHYERPNPQIDFTRSAFRVNTELRPWARQGDLPRRAGVSAFGFGGTNAHAVLEEAPAPEPSAPASGWQLLPLSAKNDAALTRVVEGLARYLRDHPDANLADVAYTLQIGRREHSQRAIVACRDVRDAADVLGTPASPRILRGTHKSGHRAVQFMFTGQGAQYPNMGLGLYRAQPVFRDAVDRCCERLKSSLGFDLREALFPAAEAGDAGDRLQRTEVTQPALFTIEYALATLWMSLGVQPTAMIGHSIGEYVAACLAGVMSLEDALDLVAERGRLMGQLPAGSMLAVPMAEVDVLPLLGDRLSLAGVNSPMMCVVSGPTADIESLEARLVADGQQPRRLRTSHAFHSSMMVPILDAFATRVRRVELHPPGIPYVSNVTGDWITPEQATDPTYYATHLRQAVRFSDGLERLFADSNAVFLEVGPGNTLASLAKRHPGHGPEHAFVTSTRRPDEKQDDEAAFLEGMGRLWLAGVRPSWEAVHGGARRRRVILPTYPFQGRRYWLETGKPATAMDAGARKPDVADWVYVPSWKRVPNPKRASTDTADRARWLVFADEAGVAEQLTRRLIAQGDVVTTVRLGSSFENRGDGSFAIAPANEQHYDALLTALAEELPTRILHLWGVTRADSGPSLESELERFFSSPVCLAKALGRVGLGKKIEITFVANGLYEVNGTERLIPSKATLLGPCRVIPHEYPGVTCRCIDVGVPESGKCSEQLLDQLVGELRTTPIDDSIAFRGPHRWVRTYEPVRVPAADGRSSRLRDHGVYLITGGLGGIGMALAEDFAARAPVKLVLVGRGSLPEPSDRDSWLRSHPENDRTSKRIRKVQGLEAKGAEVLVVNADVTDRDRMAEIVEMVRQRWGAIHGVVHAAGLPGGGVMELKTLESAHAVLAPKLSGTMVLAEVLADTPLDFMVLCSSLSVVLGGAGQVDYAAANAFLDAFAQARAVDRQPPAVAIGWDAWSEAGMAVETEIAQKLLAKQRQEDLAAGIRNAEGADLTYRLLDCALPHVVVSPRDLSWRIARSVHPAETATGEDEKSDLSSTSHARPALSTPYEAPRDDVERLLADIWGTMLGVDRVGIHDNFFELGGDSVISIQITAKANQAGLKFTPRQAFEHQTVAALAAVVRECAAAAASTKEAPRTLATTAKAAAGRGPSAADLAEIRRQLATKGRKNA